MLVMTTAQSSEVLSDLVRRTLQDLALIRQSLSDVHDVPDCQTVNPKFSLDMELTLELKSVVDELRELLWAYIKALAAKSGRHPHEVLELYKMELAVSMLREAGSRSGSMPEKE